MTPAIVAAVVSGLLGGGGIVAGLRLLIDRRKARVDEVNVITNAAAEYVGIVRDEIKHLRERVEAQDATVAAQTAENAELRHRVEVVESKLLSAQRSVRNYSRWSKRAYEELVSLGSDIDPPPSDEGV